MSTLLNSIKNFPIFSNLILEELEAITSIIHVKEFTANEVILNEGDFSESVCILLRGKVPVNKDDSEKKRTFSLEELEAGEIFGEMCFTSSGPRSATIVAINDSNVGFIDKNELLSLGKIGNSLYGKLLSFITTALAERFRKTNNNYIKALEAENNRLKLQRDFGKFFIVVLIAFGLANIANYLISHYSFLFTYPRVFNAVYLLVLLIPTIGLVRAFNYPLSFFGVTLKNSGKTILESSLLSGIIIFLTVVADKFLFSKMNIYLAHNDKVFHFSFLYYFPHAYIQEFIMRGVVQTSLINFFDNRSEFTAIFYTSCIFALFHLHQGLTPTAIVFFAGLLFGFIYQRQKNLLGISIIHFVLGGIGFYFGLTTSKNS